MLGSRTPLACMPVFQTASLPGRRPGARDPWRIAAYAFIALMYAIHVRAALNSQAVPDFWRDFYWASAIAHGEAFPFAGPQIYQMVELGPWWFYLLALPVRLGAGSAGTLVFVQLLAASKYPLAWRLGARMVDTRFGLACVVGLAVAGWSAAGLVFPSHIALVELVLLLLAAVTWRCAVMLSTRNALLYGFACAACIHAHPTTVTFVAASGVFLLWRHRSRAAFARLALAASIVLLSLLPPWLDRDAVTEHALKPLSGYLGGDVGVGLLHRIPGVAWGVLAVGAWWGLLLMTPLPLAAAQAAWWLYCLCLVFVAAGYARLPAVAPASGVRLRFVGGLAFAAFLAQVAFVVSLRPITPVWMVPSCVLPLALAIAIGWYGWFARPGLARRAGTLALCVYAAIVVAPYSLFLHDIRELRQMPGANPYYDAGDRSDTFVTAPVPFYPAVRIDRIARELCRPATLHARLAAVVEATFAAPVRDACGHWPEFLFGGIAGDHHLAGLRSHAARASGVAPARVVAGMALYEHVRPIAPEQGGRAERLRRLQIDPDSAAGSPRPATFEFDAEAGDAVVLTNRLPLAAPMTIDAVVAGGQPARLADDDGSERVYLCAACADGARVHWRVDVQAVIGNIDLVVLERAR